MATRGGGGAGVEALVGEVSAVAVSTGATDVRTKLPVAIFTGDPPLLPPPMPMTRVDRIDVFPDGPRFEPSCNGMISFRVPLSRTILVAVMSVMVYP